MRSLLYSYLLMLQVKVTRRYQVTTRATKKAELIESHRNWKKFGDCQGAVGSEKSGNKPCLIKYFTCKLYTFMQMFLK